MNRNASFLDVSPLALVNKTSVLVIRLLNILKWKTSLQKIKKKGYPVKGDLKAILIGSALLWL
jgi:hypothetical protein